MKVNIHYDCDGVLRNFHSKAFEIFFRKYPKYKKYLLPVGQFTGWGWDAQFKASKAVEIDELLDEEIFGNDENAYEVFSEAKPFISPEEWRRHVDMVMKKFPDAILTISTHQYNNVAREATSYWLGENQFTDDDKINVLYTGKKDSYGAHFLLDDKPTTIEQFHTPQKAIGVLRINSYSNAWYFKQLIKNNENIRFPYAKTLDDYYKIICQKVKDLI